MWTCPILTFSNRTEQILEDSGDSIAPPPRRRVGVGLLPALPILASTSCARRTDEPIAESALNKPSVDKSAVAKSESEPVAEPIAESSVTDTCVAELAIAESAVTDTRVAELAIAEPASAESCAAISSVAEPAVAKSIAKSAAGVDEAAVEKAAVDQSTVDQSDVDQSVVDQSSVDNSGVAEHAVADHMDEDHQHDIHCPSPAPPPRTPSPEPLQGASRTEGGIFRGRATGNVVNMADLDEQPAEPHPRDRTGRVLFFTSRDPDARPHLSMRHLVTPSLHSILSDLGNQYSPVRSKSSADCIWQLVDL